MVLSRALRERLAANAEAARLEEFAATLLTVLEDPQVAESVADAVLRAGTRRQARTPRPVITTVTAARDLKTQRLAARGRQHG